MKALLLLFGITLSPLIAFSTTWIAVFDDYGRIEITTDPKGLRFHTDLQVEPKNRYTVKLTSSCQTLAPYRTYFRQSLAIDLISDTNGKVSSYAHIPLFTEKDLVARQLNSITLYKLEKAHRRALKCVALQELETDSDKMPNFRP